MAASSRTGSAGVLVNKYPVKGSADFTTRMCRWTAVWERGQVTGLDRFTSRDKWTDNAAETWCRFLGSYCFSPPQINFELARRTGLCRLTRRAGQTYLYALFLKIPTCSLSDVDLETLRSSYQLQMMWMGGNCTAEDRWVVAVSVPVAGRDQTLIVVKPD